MGLEQSAIAWVGSYLGGRKQSCSVDGHLSSSLDLLSCGVPQGSIGGPLLWLCFTCDQPDVIHEHEVDGQDHGRGCVRYQDQIQGHDEPGLYGRGTRCRSGAGAAAGGPPIDQPLPAGAAHLASVAPWTDGLLGFV